MSTAYFVFASTKQWALIRGLYAICYSKTYFFTEETEQLKLAHVPIDSFCCSTASYTYQLKSCAYCSCLNNSAKVLKLYMRTHLCVHVCTYVCVYVCMCVYM